MRDLMRSAKSPCGLDLLSSSLTPVAAAAPRVERGRLEQLEDGRVSLGERRGVLPVGGLARAILGRPGAAGGVEGLSCHMRQQSKAVLDGPV